MSIRMLSSMLYHVISPLKRLSTEITDMRPFRRMGQQMSIPHMRRSEVLLANVTRVRFHTCVSSRVRGQIPLRGEHLSTFFAFVRSTVLLHVIVQILLRQQPLVANVALELVLVQMRHLSVLVQRIIARVKFSTDVAHVLGIAVRPDMKLQIPLHLETFSTMFTGEFVIIGVPSDVMRLEIVLCFRAVIALVATMQQTGIDILMDQPMGLQVAIILERFVASWTLERSMEAVFAGNMAEDLALLFESGLANVAGIRAIVELFVQMILLRRILVIFQFFRTIVSSFLVLYFPLFEICTTGGNIFRFNATRRVVQTPVASAFPIFRCSKQDSSL